MKINHLSLIVFISFLISCSQMTESKNLFSPKYEGYEAHALGQIDSTNYTNCKEAFYQNYEKGFRIFETDICVTDDNIVVLAHDLEMFNSLSNMNFTSLSYNDFLKTKILGKYTTLTFDFVIDRLLEFDDLIFNLDILGDWKKSFELINNKLSSLNESQRKKILNRLIFEVYSIEESLYLKENYSDFDLELCYWNLKNVDHDAYAKKLCTLGIDKVSIPYIEVNLDVISKYKDKNIKLFVFTLDDEKKLEELKSFGIDGVCTNVLYGEWK